MRIISRKTLREFWEQHQDARQPLQAWYADVKQATWKTPADIKNVYRNASIIAIGWWLPFNTIMALSTSALLVPIRNTTE
jgi:mRNA-degrading endonuclease HigB of HigAB toxin-antitoxin module